MLDNKKLWLICQKYYHFCKQAAFERATLHRDKYGYYVKVGEGRAYLEDGQIVVRMHDDVIDIEDLALEFGMPGKKLIDLIRRDFIHALEWAKDKEIQIQE